MKKMNYPSPVPKELGRDIPFGLRRPKSATADEGRASSFASSHPRPKGRGIPAGKMIVANWKCNPTSLQEASELFAALKKELKDAEGVEVVVCPPFVYLPLAAAQQSFKTGAQNCFWEEKGAFTGEVSPMMLKDLDIDYVILGHSERRQVFGETDKMINQKVKQVLKTGLQPILCVGETDSEKQKKQTFEVLARGLKDGLQEVGKKQIAKVIIAYEPIWTIGTRNRCNEQETETCSLFIRKTIADLFSKKAAIDLVVLYGGSVKAENAASYLKIPSINGLLVGGASLDPAEFAKIAKSA